ncbi:fimbrial protein [Aeromonas veronii]|uniref:fimbrial protein n=1 Tax=Aeromonas veronii TaxID=654 RepID=UPI00111625CB|nr:fimbrial protein [Aeromonas veronii]TNI00327.1 fimbrial protein [Aeromonas veronii]HDO1314118.1 type 1 fimbrial protein [Aeromonas veronii]HDO1322956.1 type 1 fimbrial protein [Aeromonas veronii]
MNFYSKAKLAFIMTINLFCQFAFSANSNVQLQVTGQIVSQPCYLKAGDELIKVDMSTITDQDFSGSLRTKSKQFQIHLERCNPIVAKSLKVTFRGAAVSGDNTLLAIDSTSNAKGIAIGLEEKDGTPVSMNKASKLVSITNGNMVLEFGAYVKVVSSTQLSPGFFKASAQCIIEYQ